MTSSAMAILSKLTTADHHLVVSDLGHECKCGLTFNYINEFAAHLDAMKDQDLMKEEILCAAPAQKLEYKPLRSSTVVTREAEAISLEELLAYRKELFTRLDAVAQAKGNDYCGAQQNSGDTLFNLRVAEILGIVPTAEIGILVRLSDKLMRLVSLTKPGASQQVKDESIEETCGDVINYVSYIGAMIRKRATSTATSSAPHQSR